MNKPDFTPIIKMNPAGFILREKIEEGTGYLISRRNIANLDSKGEGIKGRFRIGRKIAYPVQAVVDFLEERAEVLG